MLLCFLCFVFFKQKTAYEMRISDWSSDVCSSDLKTRARELVAQYGMPVGAASGVLDGEEHILAEARRIGFPILVKPAGGGGGIGMLPAHDEAKIGRAHV